jgi:type VI secretion system VgrG family protein
MTAVNTAPVHFSFESQAVASDTFEVTAFTGVEEISRPYRFQIDLVADSPDIDLEKLLCEPATLCVEKGDAMRKIHGVAAQCQLREALPEQRFCYRLVLVPRLWLLCLSRQNQIYLSQSVPDIVAEEIKGSTAKGTTKEAKSGLTGDDFESRLTRSYPEREYVVQYAETDLNFISRLMEHEGIFYFFEQGDQREKLIIGDNNIHFAALDQTDTIAYRPPSGLARSGDEAVLAFTCTARRLPRKLVLKDYNYRMPHVMLQADAGVDDRGHGLICEYGDHFKSPEEGNALARIRAQELFCTQRIFEGQTDSLRLAPGRRFKLDEHFRESFNSEYVVTRMTHKGRQPLAGAAGLQAGGPEAASYDNTITCIPAHVAYCPPRKTPKPVVPGIMNAHVDAALIEDRAEIDAQGRYKLVMPFDLSGAQAGKATRFVRKAQPYGGQDMGMHFPLHKGTEVICNFVNGDPDRPIIIGVVPNNEKKSVVTAENYTRNVIKTPSGVLFEINDGKPPKK